ncbi:hypothetical protein ACQJBY_073175 [Aegilops geniculata]
MCLEFGSCFGGRRRDDYGGRARSRGGGYWSAPVPAPVYQQPPAAVHEAYHDGAPKADHAHAGSHAAYLQDQTGGETPARHPAWHHNKGDDTGNGAHTPRPHEAAADHRDNNAAMDYHPRQVLASR